MSTFPQSLRCVRPTRRGNSIILVIGLIILLLIVAISYLTRAQSIRSTAAAYRESAIRDISVDGVAEDIANEIASSLFVRPIEVQDASGGVLLEPVDESLRKPPFEEGGRYGIDPNFSWNFAPWAVKPWTNPPDWLTYPNQPGLQAELFAAGGAGSDPFDPIWLDTDLGVNGGNSMVLAPRQNPRGGPGSGDTRWLRDTEPIRRPTDRFLGISSAGNDSYGLVDKQPDAFSHWMHMSNLARPGNDWRVVRDIADVTGARAGGYNAGIQGRGNWIFSDTSSTPGWENSPIDGHHYHGGLVERLDIPIEQWPVQSPTADNELLTGIEKYNGQELDSGQAVFTDDVDFWNRWNRWFSAAGYRNAYASAVGSPSASGYPVPTGDLLPHNFYDLSDLDGDGRDGEYFDPALDGKLGERPDDAFRKGTARWHVERVLTDTDNDGFTDSFWWLSPHTAPGGLKQIVGVSVTDNAGRLNANVATRFIRGDVTVEDTAGVGYRQLREGTRGWNPADLALMGQGTPPLGDTPWSINADNLDNDIFMEPDEITNGDVWNVGFFDNRANWSGLFAPEWLAYSDGLASEISPADQGQEVFVGFNPAFFRDQGTPQNFANALGLLNNTSFPDDHGRNQNPASPPVYGAGLDIHDRDNRRFYFQEAGLNPLDPGGFFTPFGIGEELELRSYEGNNIPWLFGRFEQSLNPEFSTDPFSGSAQTSLLRSGQDREESSSRQEQLGNRQLVADNRRKLTFFNSTRNDTMPPWLWLENRFGRVSVADVINRHGTTGGGLVNDVNARDVNGDGLPDDGFPRFVPHASQLRNLPLASVPQSSRWAPDGDVLTDGAQPEYRGLWDQYHRQMRQKIDLREWEQPAPSPQLLSSGLVTDYDPQTFSQRLPMALYSALTSGELNDSWADRYQQYFLLNGFNPLTSNDNVRWDAAAFAARTTRDSAVGSGSYQRGGGFGGIRTYSGDQNLERVRQTAAMLAANMGAWRDPDNEAPLFSTSWSIGGRPAGEIGPVPLPRLDGWESNLDPNDPEFNPSLGAWRPAYEDQFIDGQIDPITRSDEAYYAAFYPTEEDVDRYVGNDFDGFGYPRLFDAAASFTNAGVTVPAIADPWQGASVDTAAQVPGSYVNFADGGYSAAEQQTRQTVRHVAALGMEAQPFITETFLAHVVQPVPFPLIDGETPGDDLDVGQGQAAVDFFWNEQGLGPPHSDASNAPAARGYISDEYPFWILAHGTGDIDADWDFLPQSPAETNTSFDKTIHMPNVRPADTVAVVQLANPYDTPLPLFDRFVDSSGNVVWKPRYAIRLFGQLLPLSPQYAGSGSSLASVSYLNSVTPDARDDEPGFGIGLPIDPSTRHGLVLPPATHDRPYTLTVVSLPAARRDILARDVGNADRWSLADNQEGYQWLDFLDVLPFQTGDGRVESPPPLQSETFEFGGDTYTVNPGDLTWIVRPRNDSGSGTPDEIWATNRLFYDGEQGNLGSSILDGGTPTVAGVELVRIDRSPDIDGDGRLDTTGIRSNGTSFNYNWRSGQTPPSAFEYGDDETPGQGLPAQQVVIDRSTRWNATEQKWEDPLLESVTGIQWNGNYTQSGDSMPPTSDLFPACMRLHRLAAVSDKQWPEPLGNNANATLGGNPPIAVENPDFASVDDEYEWTKPSRADAVGNPGPQNYQWSLFPDSNARGLDSWGDPGWEEARNAGWNAGAISDPDTSEGIADRQWKKAQETRWIQWTRYARPWGLDPEWPFHSNTANDSAILSVGDGRSLTLDAPQRQMEMAAPRYVLGQGVVTRSYGRTWAEDQGYAPGESNGVESSLWGNSVPLVIPEYFPNQNASGYVAGEDWATSTAELPLPNPAMNFAEQIVDYGSSTLGELNGPDGRTVFVKVIDDNDDPRLHNYTSQVDADVWSQEDLEEAARFKESTLLHGDLVHLDLPSVEWDGEGSTVVYSADGGTSVDGVPYFPWLTRNQRLPKVFLQARNGTVNTKGYVYRNRKPIAFDMIAAENGAGYLLPGGGSDPNNPWSFPDKGVYSINEMNSEGGFNTPEKLAAGGYYLDEEFLAPFSFQMNHKDGNFEQVGEVLNVWTHAHLVSHPFLDNHYPGNISNGGVTFPDPTASPVTIRTFSESLSRELAETEALARTPLAIDAEGVLSGGLNNDPTFGDQLLFDYREGMRDALRRVGRLEVSPGAYARNEIVGEPRFDFGATTQLLTSSNQLPGWIRPNGEVSHLEPEQPAGQRVLDLFVCDGPGIYDLFNNQSVAASFNPDDWQVAPDGIIDDQQAYEFFLGRDPRLMNAHGFSGQGTPGMVNVNTASVEVLRSLPHMYRLVHGTGNSGTPGSNVLDVDYNGANVTNRNPRVAIPEAIVQYRDQSGSLLTTPTGSIFAGDANHPSIEPELDADRNGTVEPFEMALTSGFASGPSYRGRGTHTPVSNANAENRWNLSALQSYPLVTRANAGLTSGGLIRRPDGIALSSGTRGFNGVGELFQLESPPSPRIDDSFDLVGTYTDPEAWRIDFAARRPFRRSTQFIDDASSNPLRDERFEFTSIGAPLSTDTSTIRDSHGSTFVSNEFTIADNFQRFLGKAPTYERIEPTDSRYRERLLGGDMVSGDAEEANLLFSGISNMVSTRSDMFTVHFRVRTFKPDPESGVWDATNRDAIVDDSFYVMLVDRSEVEKPGDQPRIVYLEKIEN